MKLAVIWTLLLVLIYTHNHQYNCVFDHLNQDLREKSAKQKPDVLIHQPGSNINGRLLAAINPPRIPLRITLDYNAFNATIQPGVNGANTTTTTKLNFILRTMMVTQTFFQSRLKVGEVGGITAPSYCVDFQPSSTAQVGGYSQTDLVIFVQYITDKNQTYGATGKSCKYITPGAYPDYTLQMGRPTVGRIIFNTYRLVDLQTTLTNRLFQSVTSTALHQTMHILGFDSTLYSTYLDPTTGSPYTSGPLISNSSIINANRNGTSIITTSNVLTWARNHFGCSNLSGMPVQNQDGGPGGGGSHWERVAMYDELMTATALGTAKYFSGLTFAFLKDMGWYTVDDSFAETSNYGYQKGCSFVLDACYSNTSFTQFCNVATQSSVSYCSSHYVGKAICTTESNMMADGCAMYGQYFSCVDPTSPDTGNYKAKSLQVFGTSSFCVSSTMGQDVLPSTLQSRCYPYVCNADNSITFTIGSYTVKCLSNQAGLSKTLSGLSGYLTCPSYTNYCTMSRKMCTNFCSQNGYCTGGICNCYDGYYGSDCSKTSCNTGQYYVPTNNTCSTTCPSGYYSNKFSHSCEPCKAPCSECVNSATNCIGCQTINGVVQYFYNGACSSSCPPQTYSTASLNCVACDTTGAFCYSCSIYPDNCTSCQPNKYLAQPLQMNINITCVSTCPISYSKRDQTAMVCRTNCLTYQLELGNGSCVLCTAPLFMGTGGTCDPNCSAGYYPQTTNRACVICDTTCLTCIGPYPQNCTSCKLNTGNKFLLLKMCWPLCPKGFYPDTTLGLCTLCPSNLYCSSCAYDSVSNSPYCTACMYGYFYNSTSKTCGTSCLSSQYKNTWNNSCSNCDPSCSTCNGPTSYSCLSCPGTSLLLTNSTGGYCLSACPTVGYIQNTQNGTTTCQPCDTTCNSCNGVGADKCYNCSVGYYLSGGYCRYVCPNGTYPNSTTNKCLACDSSCSYCFGGSNSSCTSCAPSLYLYNFTCTSSCPNGMAPNQWNVCFQGWMWVHYVTYFLLLMWFF